MISGTPFLDNFTKQSELLYQPWAIYFQTVMVQGINFCFVSATVFWDCFVGAF